MKKTLSVLLTLMLIVCMLPIDAFAMTINRRTPYQVVRITHNRKVNVRSGPSASYRLLGEASPGDEFRYLGSSGGWYHIQFTSTTQGYVSGNLSTVETRYTNSFGIPTPMPAPSPTPAPVDGYVHITNYRAVNVRRGPGTNYSVICEVQPGDCFPYLGTSCGWHYIMLDDETTGYVANNMTELEGYEWEIDDPEIISAPGGGSNGGHASGRTCYSCNGRGRCKLCGGVGGQWSINNIYHPCGLCGGMGTCYLCYGLGVLR
ncbi:MAG: SH3 domain-containing protein [Clostridia bacterium]|nr:SH3 domain-containing protein [Clostridia bacterium]